MKTILTYAGYAAAAVITIDVLGFIAWALSGQVPVDGFYVGTLTTHALRALLF